MNLAGAQVLLTGATGGLGQAIARALAERGASLTLTGRRADVLEPLAAELGGRALAARPGDPAAAAARRGSAGARSRPTWPTRRRRRGCWPTRERSTCSWPTPGCRAAAR